MSLLAQLGGTEAAPTILRVGAIGLASYGALTWVGNAYGIDILSATPHRILAAGIIAVGSEFALRHFSDEKKMHVHRLRTSMRALQKDLQDPENRKGVVEILRNDAGLNITDRGFDALCNGDFQSGDASMLDDIYTSAKATEDMLKRVVSGKSKEEAREESETIRDLREDNANLEARLEALEAILQGMSSKDKKKA